MLETHKICNNYDILSFPQNAKSQNQLQSTKHVFTLEEPILSPQIEAKADLIPLCHKAAHVNKQSVSRYACCHEVVI